MHMSKTWETKKKIFKFLSNGPKTPGEISQSLGLAPSTVSEHIESLERMNAIKLVENPHIRKWKYYRSNPDFSFDTFIGEGMTNKIPQIAAIVVIAAIIIGALALSSFGSQALKTGNIVGFQLTDPPHVPSGTQALLITYSSLEAHVSSGSNSSGQWIKTNGSGTLNLTALVNSSQIIGNANIPVNASINQVRLEISSAQIRINNTTYNVTVPGDQITAQLKGNESIAQNSGVLIDMSPTVAAIYTSNSTVFVMVPSVKAIVIGNGSVSANVGVGKRVSLSSSEVVELRAVQQNITITSASVASSGNRTAISVTVKNYGNSSVDIRHIAVYGLPSVLVETNGSIAIGSGCSDLGDMLGCGAGTAAHGNGSVNIQIQSKPLGIYAVRQVLATSSNAAMSVETTNTGVGNVSIGSEAGSNTETNANGVSTVGLNTIGLINVRGIEIASGGSVGIGTGAGIGAGVSAENQSTQELIQVGVDARNFGVINFAVTSNGTMILPLTEQAGIEAYSRIGYVLTPGASATFSFSGPLIVDGGHIRISPVIGRGYTVSVMGNAGASASTHIIAIS
jgi:DNA-binding transcriptional ArsR family regulator